MKYRLEDNAVPKRADEFAFRAVKRSHDALLVATLAVFADHINAF
jgi:hypothetical protein